MELRDTIQRIVVEWPSYERPRITHELRRRGWQVNTKRVYRLMREDNLLCVRRRKFVVTTDSNHGRKVYPNLARNNAIGFSSATPHQVLSTSRRIRTFDTHAPDHRRQSRPV
jgi:transposase InsO family protein